MRKYFKVASLLLLIFLSDKVVGQNYASIHGIVKDKYTLQFLPNTNIVLLSKNGSKKEFKTSQKGQFVIDSLESDQTYKIRFNQSRYFDETIEIQLVCDTLLNIFLCRIPMNVSYFPYVGFEFNKSYFSANYKDSLFSLLKLLNTNPYIVIGIIGYKDSTEKDTGIVLSRMKEVRKYLIAEGIDSNRLILQKSNKPNSNIFEEAENYNCDGKGHDLLTEDFLRTIKDEKKREALRSMNRWVWFKVLSDDFKK